MAVRFSADGQDYTRALALGNISAFTVACWFKITSDRNTYSTIWSIDNSTANNWVMQTNVDGTTMGVVADGNTLQNMGSLTAGTWYFACLAINGSTGTLYYKSAAASALSSVAISGGTSTVNAATLRIGESPWGTEWLNGCVAALKIWTGVQITAAEAAQEAGQYLPNRLSGLTVLHPFVKAETIDYSGNARTLSGGAGAATEAGPPIPWRAPAPAAFLRTAAVSSQNAAAAITGIGNVTVGAGLDAVSAAAILGVGQVAAAGVRTQVSAVAINGAGTVVAAATPDRSAVVSISAAGAVTAGASVAKNAAVAIQGVGLVTAQGAVTEDAAVAIVGVGVLTAAAVRGAGAAAAILGAGTVSATTGTIVSTAAAIAGAGVLTAAGGVTAVVAAAIVGGGQVGAGAVAVKNAAAALLGAGLVTATTSGPNAAAAITAAGSLAAAAGVTRPGTAALLGISAVTVGASTVRIAAAVIVGAGSVTVALGAVVPARQPRLTVRPTRTTAVLAANHTTAVARPNTTTMGAAP